MGIVNVQALKSNNCVLYWPGSTAISGVYDDDGNKRGFLILPDGVTVTPSGTFAVEKMKDGRNIWKFDGSTNVIYIPGSWSFGANDFTICAWIKITVNSTYQNIIGSTNANGTHLGLGLRITNTNVLHLLFHTNPSTNYHAYSASTITSGVWVFVTAMRRSDVLYIYINNVLDGTPAAVSGTIYSAGDWYAIGRVGIYADDPTYFGFANGSIKDLMIFKGKALSQDQIAAIYRETYIY